MPELEIIGGPQSNFVWATRIALGEKRVPYRLTDVMPHTPEFDPLHPFSKLPVLRHGDFTLCESKAIATYLDRGFPGPALMPGNPKDEAVAEQWISLVNTAMDPILVRTYVYHYIRPLGADGKPDQPAIEAMVPALWRHIGLLDQAVACTGHLAGERFTLADINVMPMLHVLRLCPESADAIAAATHLSAYYDRHAARPSFKNTNPPPGPPRFTRPA